MKIGKSVAVRSLEGRPLTPKERNILQLAAKGFDGTEAARHLCISSHTRKSYCKVIYAKLQACTMAEAVYRATKEGLIA